MRGRPDERAQGPDAWFFLLLLAIAPVSLIGIFAPLPLWALAVAAPVGIAAWMALLPLKRQPARYVLAAIAIAIGLGAMVAGETDDAPGLVLLGLLLVAGAIAFGVRTARRGAQAARASATADTTSIAK